MFARSAAPPPALEIEIRVISSTDDFQTVLDLRGRVFRDEQGLADLPMTDPDESKSLTVLASIEGVAVGTGRLTPPSPQRLAYLSWIATLPRYRRRGVGAAIVRALLTAADEAGYPQTLLSAQSHAIDFYRQFGFLPLGETFTVRGIRHQSMSRLRSRSD